MSDFPDYLPSSRFRFLTEWSVEGEKLDESIDWLLHLLKLTEWVDGVCPACKAHKASGVHFLDCPIGYTLRRMD